MDVHKKPVAACFITPEGREIRAFRTMTEDLPALSRWLKEHQVTRVAMGSAGVHRKPVCKTGQEFVDLGHQCFEERGRAAITRQAIRRLERLGHKVTLEVA